MGNALAKLDYARTRLAKASTLPELKQIRDRAESAKDYVKKAKLGLEAQNYAAEIALQAARKDGAILKQLQKTQPQSAAKVAGDSEYRKTLKATGTPDRTARYWQRLAEVTEFIAQLYFDKVRKTEKGEITAAGLLREAAKQGRVIASFTDDPENRRLLMEHGRIGDTFYPSQSKYKLDVIELLERSWIEDGSSRVTLNALNDTFDVQDLAKCFGAPPFSTVDLRQGYWLDRKRAWEALGIRGEAGRGDQHEAVHSTRILHFESGTNISVFNPAVTETMYQWFAPEGGRILDPFAGGATRGIVASALKYKYTGIELRSEQVEENRKQDKKVRAAPTWIWPHHEAPTWICGDSSQLSRYVAGQEFDLIFTCPPYYDLERYTAIDERDGSRCKTYEDFMAWYENIFRQAIQHLRQDRFVVVVVGEIRDKKGWYRNFVGDTVSCLQRLGLHYYNEIILLDPIGSAPLRAGKPFSQYRKVQKAHQNVLVFWKGDDVKRIPKAIGVLKEVKFKMEQRPPILRLSTRMTHPAP